MPKPVTFRHVAVAITQPDPTTGTQHDSQIVAVDTEGRIWERHSYSKAWGQIEAPVAPPPKRKRRATKG